MSKKSSRAYSQKILLQIDASNFDATAKPDPTNPDNLMWSLHTVYDALKKPKPNDLNKLSTDLHRMSHVFVPNDDEYHDIISTLTKAFHKEPNSGQKLISNYLTNNDNEKINKLEGLCQNIGNSIIIGFLKNFTLQVNNELHKNIIMKGKQYQNIVKISEQEFRLDYDSLQYFFLGENDNVYVRDKQGNIKEFPSDILQKVGDPHSIFSVGPDGLAKISWKEADGTSGEIECLPFMKASGSATVKFDEHNESTVTLGYSFESFTPALHYNGPKTSPEIVSIKTLDESFQSAIPLLEQFPGLNTTETNDSLKVILKIVNGFQTSSKNILKKKISSFLKRENRSPIREMDLYMQFFKQWKLEQKISKGILSDFLGIEKEHKKRVLAHIFEWEKRVISCPYSKRNELMKKMLINISALKPKTIRERIKQLFSKVIKKSEKYKASLNVKDGYDFSKKMSKNLSAKHYDLDELTIRGKSLSEEIFTFGLHEAEKKLRRKYKKEIEKDNKITIKTLKNAKQQTVAMMIEIAKNNEKKDVVKHFQNEKLEAESNLSANPGFEAIAVLFELHDPFHSIEMDPCGHLDSLMKIYKSAKFSGREVKFALTDLKLLESSTEYLVIKDFNIAQFLDHLRNTGELSFFEKHFVKKERTVQFTQYPGHLMNTKPTPKKSNRELPIGKNEAWTDKSHKHIAPPKAGHKGPKRKG